MTAQTLLWSLGPALLSALCLVLSLLCPTQHVTGQAAAALLAMAPRWLLAVWPLWALAVGLRRRAVVAPLLCGVVGVVAGGWLPPPEGPAVGTHVVVANVNSFADAATTPAMAAALAATGAAVVVTIERRAESLPGYHRVADNYDEEMPRVSHGTAVFCRDPGCAAAVTPTFGSQTMAMPLALVRLSSGLCLLGIHGPPPAPYDPTGLGPYVARIADAIAGGRMVRDWGPCRAGDGVVVAGDLNGVPLGAAWRRLVTQGLSDPLLRWGLRAVSWPVGGGWPKAPFFVLDHVLVGAASAGGVAHFAIPGSDHRGLSLWVSS